VAREEAAIAHHVLRFAAASASFEAAADEFRAALDACGARGRARYNAELVFEEIVSNVVRHGDAGAIDVSLACEPDADRIVLTFDDDGPPFDPLEQPLPGRPASIEEAPLGGLGLVLVRRASTSLRYERTGEGKNRLTVALAST
jgi:anti-sigma regulatory factor (Ser/Thr protein kinase)